MAHRPEKLLADILAAGQAILDFSAGRSRAEYGADLLLRSAVERQLEILGEAVRRLDGLDANLTAQLSDHRRIIGLRNIIAHGYDGLDNDVVWQVVQQKIPILIAEATALIAALDPGYSA